MLTSEALREIDGNDALDRRLGRATYFLERAASDLREARTEIEAEYARSKRLSG